MCLPSVPPERRRQGSTAARAERWLLLTAESESETETETETETPILTTPDPRPRRGK